MNRQGQQLLTGMMACSLMMMVQSGVFGSEAAASVASNATEHSFLQQLKAPWLSQKFQEWRAYLKAKPALDFVERRAGEQVEVTFSHAWASAGFDGAGRVADPSVAHLGQRSFQVQDAWVASRLLAHDEAKVVARITDTTPLHNNNAHYLTLLAGQEIAFESSESAQRFDMTYTRSFMDKRLQVKVVVPVVRKEVNLDLATAAEISKSNRNALVDAAALNAQHMRNAARGEQRMPEAPGFYESYSDMGNFVQHVLGDTGIAFLKKQEATCFGDIAVQCVYDYTMPYVDVCQFGAEVSLNTARKPRGTAFMEPSLGEGAHRLKAFAHVGLMRSVYANPFMSMSLSYCLPAPSAVRVPYVLSYNGVSHMGERMMEVFPKAIPFSHVIMLGGAAFSDYPETMVPGFASRLQDATVYKGMGVHFQLGNTFQQCFGLPMTASIAYAFEGRQQEEIGGLAQPHLYAAELMTKYTARRSHDIVMHAAYQLSSLCSLAGGLQHRFAGKNVLKATRVWGGVTLRF